MKPGPSETPLKICQHELENSVLRSSGLTWVLVEWEPHCLPGLLQSCLPERKTKTALSLSQLPFSAPESHHHMAKLAPEQDHRSSVGWSVKRLQAGMVSTGSKSIPWKPQTRGTGRGVEQQLTPIRSLVRSFLWSQALRAAWIRSSFSASPAPSALSAAVILVHLPVDLH